MEILAAFSIHLINAVSWDPALQNDLLCVTYVKSQIADMIA